jgi:SAM-dependent methyltransferase
MPVRGDGMKILNAELERDILEGNAICLDLGCGPKAREGYYAVDHLELEGVDLLADLNEPFDLFADNSVDRIYSRHTFEHVENFLPLMREMFRIVKPDGKIEIIVPHFSNVFGYSDPTHVRFFGLYTMYYFVAPENQPGKKRKVPAFYTDIRFRVKSIKIEFYRYSLFEKIFGPLFARLVNISFSTQNFYERRLSAIWHAAQIRYILEPDK